MSVEHGFPGTRFWTPEDEGRHVFLNNAPLVCAILLFTSHMVYATVIDSRIAQARGALFKKRSLLGSINAVSYTHLDVYKRQPLLTVM